MEERAWHNITRNELTRVPTKHVFVDTESYREYGSGVETQRWRCGVAIYATRRRNGEYTTNSCDYRDSQSLWNDVSDFTSGDGRTVLWAHNLGYDIRVSSMFEILPSRGWTLAGHNIAPRGTWVEWRRDGSTLVCVDSFSVFTTSIEQIGRWFGMGKLELPMDDAEMGTWLDRCRSDCGILATAILRYLRWIKEEDLGNWQMTGNAQSWAAFRHRFLTHKLTVHNDVEALAAERRAMWTGRCEAYWHGEIPDQRIFEYDFTQAYPRIARDYEVPVKLVGVIDNPEAAWRVYHNGRHAMLAEVVVCTDVPVVPTEHEGRILWPTGTFYSTLWDVEIQSALATGAKVEIRRAWIYRKGPALKSWGAWILARLNAPDSDVPAWERNILKHWSRALIGRMAMTYQKWDHDGVMPDSKVQAGWTFDETTDVMTEYVQIGDQMWTHDGRTEWKHSMPMVTGYVQAIARVDLWNVLQRMPFRSVMYTDTDSLFVTAEFRPEVEAIAASLPLGELRLKRAWDGIAIYGPRQIITGTEVRISGIPKRAQRVDKREFTGEIWEGIDTAIRFGNIDTVRIRDRKWTVSGVDRRRKGTGFGFTEPFELEIIDGSVRTRCDPTKREQNGSLKTWRGARQVALF